MRTDQAYTTHTEEVVLAASLELATGKCCTMAGRACKGGAVHFVRHPWLMT